MRIPELGEKRKGVSVQANATAGHSQPRCCSYADLDAPKRSLYEHDGFLIGALRNLHDLHFVKTALVRDMD